MSLIMTRPTYPGIPADTNLDIARATQKLDFEA